MRKPVFCICKNKDAIQPDQRLCFCYKDSTVPLLSKSEVSSLYSAFCGCAAWFVSDLVGNLDDRFSRDTVHISIFVVLH